jgi:hypothetical protein
LTSSPVPELRTKASPKSWAFIDTGASLKHAVADTLEYFAGLFTEHNVRWAVVGALAANAYRVQTRTTTDLDLLAVLSEDDYQAVRDALDRDGWQVRATGGESLAFPDIVRLRHNDYFPADVLLAKIPYQLAAVQRARLLDPIALGFALPYLSPEDVVIHKLLAYRFRDRDDLESLAKAGVALDEAYIEYWCREWEITDRWCEFRDSR